LKCYISKKNVEIIQEKLCEECNIILLHLLKDKNDFFSDAINTGRGHFIATYDGIEHDMSGVFYIV